MLTCSTSQCWSCLTARRSPPTDQVSKHRPPAPNNLTQGLKNDEANRKLLDILIQCWLERVPDGTCFMCVSAVLSPQTVVEMFYQTVARKIIISQIYSQQQSSSLLLWPHMVSNVVQLLAQLLYPQHAKNMLVW